jgi:hypothetical protein
MPSANPSIAVPTPAQKRHPFHRVLRIAENAVLPARKPLVIAAAFDLNYWLNSKWKFFWSEYAGETYTWGVEFIVYSDGSSNLFVYSAATYNQQSQQQSVQDSITGNLVVNSEPSPWLSFPPSTSATESFRDTGNSELNYDMPIDTNYAWLVGPWNETGWQWEFQNVDYSYPFNNFIITRQY